MLKRLFVGFAVLPGTAAAHEFIGPMGVLGGDTIAIVALHLQLRLDAIDAPEFMQTCTDQAGHRWPGGVEAARALACLIGRNVVECAGSGTDGFERPLVRCVAGGKQINHEMVRLGWAVPYYAATYSDMAQEARRGQIWRGTFGMPWQWRREHANDPAARARSAISHRPCPELEPRS